MIGGLKRFFLLSDWSTSGRGFGQALFVLAKGIGILGRVVAVGILLAVALACFIEPKLLMVVGYGAARCSCCCSSRKSWRTC